MTTPDRMSVSEASEALERAGYAFMRGRPVRTSLSVYDVRDMENVTLHMLYVEDKTISRKAVHSLVERMKK